MCWVGENKPLIAEENIECRKVLVFKEDKLFSPFQCFEYEINSLYCSIIAFFKVDRDRIKIENGLHCYSKNCIFYKEDESIKVFYGKSFIMDYYSSFVYRGVVCESILCKCIIPKGSTYYINNKGEIVSNQLIIEDRVIEKRK